MIRGQDFFSYTPSTRASNLTFNHTALHAQAEAGMGRRALRDGAVAVPIGLLLLLGFGCSSLAFMQPPPSLHSCRPPRIRRGAGTRMAAESLDDFMGRLGRSLVGEGTFVRLTLSNSKPKEPQPSADASQPVDKLLAG